MTCDVLMCGGTMNSFALALGGTSRTDRVKVVDRPSALIL